MKRLIGRVLATAVLGLSACGPGSNGGGGGGGPDANSPPVPMDDFYGVDEDASLVVISSAGLLINDSDPDNDPVTATLVSGPTHGTLNLQPDGSFSYTPASNYNGPDSFTYRAEDAHWFSPPATVSIDVAPLPDAPVAVNDAYSTAEDTPLVVAAPGFLANDTDADGDSLSSNEYALATSHGFVIWASNGSFTYTPVANYNGPDSFTYRAWDRALVNNQPVAGALSSNLATVSITVTPVNDAPTAVGHVYSTDALGHLTLAAPGVLAGSADVDGDALTAVLSSPATSGTLVLAANGSLTFDTTDLSSHVVSFKFSATDGLLSTAPATVSIFVNEPDPGPVYGVTEGGVVYHCPSPGGGAPVVVCSLPLGFYTEIVLDQAQTHLNILGQFSGGSESVICQVDLQSQQDYVLATLPAGILSFGLDYDTSSGMLYTLDMSGNLYKANPLTGIVTTAGGVGADMIGLAIGRDVLTGQTDTAYTYWVWNGRISKNGVVWALQPPPNGSGDFDYPMAVSVGSDGNVYVTYLYDNRIFRNFDANGDGDALGAGESGHPYATLPFTMDQTLACIQGITAAPGGQLLANVRFSDADGIYWVQDLDHDGIADAVALYNAQPIGTGTVNGGRCITAPR